MCSSECRMKRSFSVPEGMRKTSDMSPRRLSDISPQLRQLKSLVIDEALNEELKSSRSVEYINNASIEERILRITGYYGYEPWNASLREDQSSREKMEVKVDSHAATGTVQSVRVNRQERLQFCLLMTAVHLRRALWGVTVVICICMSWSGCTQLAKITVRRLNVPFTLTWFSTSWNCVIFPLYYLGHLCCSKDRQTPRQRFRECCQFFGDDGLSVRMLLSRVAPFGVLWTLTSYLYLQGLRRIPATDACALFCCSRAFVFLISWIVLRDRFMGVRIVAAILAIGGIVMMTYADGFHSHSVIGISLVVGSASTAAMYKVLFKLVLGNAKIGEAAVYLTVLGGANLVFISAVPLILLVTGAEDFVSPGDLPWPSICGMSALLLVFNFLLNFGVLITLPTLISLGVVLSVPVNAVIDRYMCEIQLNSVRVIAASIICLGFLLLLLPKDWDQCLPQLWSMLHTQEEPQECARDKHSETLHIRPREARNCNSKTTGTPSIH
ncbi:putative thiamine transporter SLC35F3a isoform X1 [Myxocyprinus asiaticus]|uniref:putative thiamine transporter SLC35F3a isoform X1 n=1 Tax=Myxocyprinus asiaticus TaxID=70543 RepID=UPI002221E342|nr:putative thiamine transporter SLC35F3a isoform X1 [Myxocyprinus asiaticus]